MNWKWKYPTGHNFQGQFGTPSADALCVGSVLMWIDYVNFFQRLWSVWWYIEHKLRQVDTCLKTSEKQRFVLPTQFGKERILVHPVAGLRIVNDEFPIHATLKHVMLQRRQICTHSVIGNETKFNCKTRICLFSHFREISASSGYLFVRAKPI